MKEEEVGVIAEPRIVNVYCDESCHLEHDGQKAMVLGAVWCPEPDASRMNRCVAEIKSAHGLSPFFEIKWGKVSERKLDFYIALVSMFFDSDNLHFRAWIVPDKSILRHKDFVQTHDDWYYKMYFNMLKVIIQPNTIYHIYLDIKDTRSRLKLQKLHEVLANANYDFRREIVARMQHVHSHNVGLLQVADLLIGAVSYSARGLETSPAKVRLLELIRRRSGLSLTRNTLPSAIKFNLCFWQPKSRDFDVQ
jgi:Protein of unknown function (DUF3800)